MKRIEKYCFSLAVILLLAFITTKMYAEESSSSAATQLWFDYNPGIKLKDGLKLYTPVGYRTIFPQKWNRFYIDPYITFDWPRMILKKMRYKEQLLGGLGVFYTINNNISNGLEFRPFQGYSLTVPNRLRLTIKHYLKLEERFELQTSDWSNTFGLRLRYSAFATIKFQGDVWDYAKGIYIPVGAEFFWNLKDTKQFNDNLRFTLGIGRKFSDEWRAAFTAGYNYTRSSVDEDFHTNNIILRLRIYHNYKGQ